MEQLLAKHLLPGVKSMKVRGRAEGCVWEGWRQQGWREGGNGQGERGGED